MNITKHYLDTMFRGNRQGLIDFFEKFNLFNMPEHVLDEVSGDYKKYMHCVEFCLEHTDLVLDALGRITRLEDSRGDTTHYKYVNDTFEPELKVKDTIEISYLYSSNNQLRAITNSLGYTQEFSYNSDGKLIDISDNEGEVLYHAIHSAQGLLVAALDDNDAVEYTYNAKGLLIKEIFTAVTATKPWKTIEYMHCAGLVSVETITSRAGTQVLEYLYHEDGQLNQLSLDGEVKLEIPWFAKEG